MRELINLLLSVMSLSYQRADWTFGPNERVNDDTVRAYQNYPAIAVDEEGNVYCVWEDWRNGNAEVYFAYKPVGGIWSKNERVLKEFPNANPGPSIVASAEGRVYCFFHAFYGSVQSDVFFIERIGEGKWSEPVKMNDDSGDNPQGSISPASDNKDNLYAIWLDSRNTGPFSSDLYFSMKSKDGNWTPNEKVNDVLGGVLYHSLAVDSAGNCYAVWQDGRNYGQYRDDIYFSFRPNGGTWSSNIRVNSDKDTMEQGWPELAVDPEGNAHCVWWGYYYGDNFSQEKCYYSFRPANGEWTPDTLLEITQAAVPMIATDRESNLYAFWGEWIGDTTVYLYLSCLPPGGKWTPKVRVTDEGASLPDHPQLAIGESNKVYCVWTDWRNNNPPANPANIDIYFCEGKSTGIEEVSNERRMPDIKLEIKPNPVYRTAYIQWQAPAIEKNIDLSIYDINGRLVKTLKKKSDEVNEHRVIWDIRDEHKREVATGVYFCQLRIPDLYVETITKKIIVMKRGSE